jgi:GntR family transcriptional regulator of vanillate catabolism
MEACLDEGDRILAVKRLTPSAREPWGEMNDNFHRLLVESTNNGALIDALARATNIPYSSSRVVHWFEEDDLQGLFALRFVHSQHHSIFQAICQGEGSRAEMTMRAHITFTSDHIRSRYFANNALENAGSVVALEDFRPKTPVATVPAEKTRASSRGRNNELASGRPKG